MRLLPLLCYNYFILRQHSADYACSTIPHGLTGSNKPLLTLLANPLGHQHQSLWAVLFSPNKVMGRHNIISINSPRDYSSVRWTTVPLYTFVKGIAGQRSKNNLTMRDVVFKVIICHQLTECLIIESK